LGTYDETEACTAVATALRCAPCVCRGACRSHSPPLLVVPSCPRTPPPWLTFNASDKPFVSTYGVVALLIDFRLDELCQVSQRLLPTEIASLQRNGIGQAFLHNIKLGAERDFLERPQMGKLWVGEFRAETSPAWSWRGPSAPSDCCLQQYQSKVEFGSVLPKMCLETTHRPQQYQWLMSHPPAQSVEDWG
jgi:hypothetical protein